MYVVSARDETFVTAADTVPHDSILSRAPGLKTGRCLKISVGHLSHPLLTVFTFGIHKIDVKYCGYKFLLGKIHEVLGILARQSVSIS